MIILASNPGIPAHKRLEVERLIDKNQGLFRSADRDFPPLIP
ncbi:hypothetical protein MTo_01112 [Microcystis aeruginosa NIES-1211]|uniref:Uncharacterized protein n=1 Tax=Microcystis aeruginosa NIES-2519 TaxID=2303981 RepID=A0A5A5R930_MICAE|nr:hypothetical protein MTo_01112 [Microcystis aeruginosa NIES-1211]GCA69677.1 hypothetical protein MiYa_01206 [Microcystis aeruginosa NIES-2519]GCA84158.1 hypothetical protein MiHa_02129 [Microcystis aeruginosa NIES-2522]GCA90380.1 hypothetical protein MiTa_03739 [Microcystis aeruginosa NIES-4264]